MVYTLRQKSAAKDRTSYLFPVPTTDLQIPLRNKYVPKQQHKLLPLKASSFTRVADCMLRNILFS